MPKPNLYRMLGVSTRAAPGEIKRAYRRIAFSAHPDVGAHPDADRFREAHEAYAILSDPARRHSYDVELAKARRPAPAEPLRARAAVNLGDDFLVVRPSTELFDPVPWRFFNPATSECPPRRVALEVLLDVDEARFGCRVPFSLPTYARCPTCNGTGDDWGLCPTCYAGGVVEVDREVVLDIPPGARDGEMLEVYLGGVGTESLLLEVRVVVT